ncbi:hypothetical protein [Streptomyces violascens]|uniref:hypothetical protein n=1 Tax=Streptomyces violascens TaxID=67381 RepID=UPI0036C95232
MPQCGGSKTDACGDECWLCEVTGWLDMPVGYACSPSPQDLLAVVAFEGTATTYRDGPRLLYYGIPTHVVESLTWQAFIARHLA